MAMLNNQMVFYFTITINVNDPQFQTRPNQELCSSKGNPRRRPTVGKVQHASPAVVVGDSLEQNVHLQHSNDEEELYPR